MGGGSWGSPATALAFVSLAVSGHLRPYSSSHPAHPMPCCGPALCGYSVAQAEEILLYLYHQACAHTFLWCWRPSSLMSPFRCLIPTVSPAEKFPIGSFWGAWGLGWDPGLHGFYSTKGSLAGRARNWDPLSPASGSDRGTDLVLEVRCPDSWALFCHSLAVQPCEEPLLLPALSFLFGNLGQKWPWFPPGEAVRGEAEA